MLCLELGVYPCFQTLPLNLYEYFARKIEGDGKPALELCLPVAFPVIIGARNQFNYGQEGHMWSIPA